MIEFPPDPKSTPLPDEKISTHVQVEGLVVTINASGSLSR